MPRIEITEMKPCVIWWNNLTSQERQFFSKSSCTKFMYQSDIYEMFKDSIK